MGSLLYEMNQFLLGDLGKGILSIIKEKNVIFLCLFIIYGGLHLYAKTIYLYYIPNKINQFVNDNAACNIKELYKLWEEERKKIPLYILVPVHKEMWVQPLRNTSGKYSVLFFNEKNSYDSENELILKKFNHKRRLINV